MGCDRVSASGDSPREVSHDVAGLDVVLRQTTFDRDRAVALTGAAPILLPPGRNVVEVLETVCQAIELEKIARSDQS